MRLQEFEGWDYCRRCCDLYLSDDRKPPCAERDDGFCTHGTAAGAEPIQIHHDDRLAWNVYVDTVTLSGADAHGLPRVDMLPDIIRWLTLDLNAQELYMLTERIKNIHSIVMTHRISKLPKSNG